MLLFAFKVYKPGGSIFMKVSLGFLWFKDCMWYPTRKSKRKLIWTSNGSLLLKPEKNTKLLRDRHHPFTKRRKTLSTITLPVHKPLNKTFFFSAKTFKKKKKTKKKQIHTKKKETDLLVCFLHYLSPEPSPFCCVAWRGRGPPEASLPRRAVTAGF